MPTLRELSAARRALAATKEGKPYLIDSELTSLPSVDKRLAEAIVTYREKNGPFKEIQEMTRVEGVTPQILEKIKDRIAMGSATDTGKKK